MALMLLAVNAITGIVNLFARTQYQDKREAVTPLFSSGSQFRARDFLPAVEPVFHFLTVRRRGESVTTRPEMLRDGTVGREEALGVAG